MNKIKNDRVNEGRHLLPSLTVILRTNMVDGEKYQVSSDLHMCRGTYIHLQMVWGKQRTDVRYVKEEKHTI